MDYRRVLSNIWTARWKTLPCSGKSGPASLGSSPLILHFGNTPTLHYYFTSRFPSSRTLDTRTTPPSLESLREVSSVVIVRHVRPDWVRLLAQAASDLPPVHFFLDDDIPGILEDAHVPLRYALKTAVRYGRAFDTLERIGVRVLVASPGLCRRYGLPASSLLPPVPLPPYFTERPRAGDGPVTVFYHGTSSHIREIQWLRDVVAGVLERLPGVVFELSGGRDVRRLYHGMDGVRVIPPMSWQSFYEYSSSISHDIGLAPLLDSPFNNCRSHVKYYDITRSGGVGIYSDVPIFRTAITSGINGLLVENAKAKWMDAVCDLAQDRERQNRLYANAASENRTLGETPGGPQ